MSGDGVGSALLSPAPGARRRQNAAGALAATLSALVLAGCQASAALPDAAAQRPESDRRFAASEWTGACANHDDWDLAGPPFRIHGDTYYVGTCGITAILIASEDGHILIDGATVAGGPLIAANVERLGFDMADVKLLLVTHEHHDHAGGLAFLQQASGARVLASPAGAPVLASGLPGEDDPQAEILDPMPRVAVAGTVADGEVVRVGDLAVTAIATPGHTAGAMSWTWRSCDGAECRQIVYLDSLSAVSAEGYRFSEHPEFVARLRASLDKVAALPCDIALTPHPGSSAMPTRIEGAGLFDPAGCRSYAQAMRERLEGRLASEASGG
jgi:metallo-beta-lactamase class B